MDIFHDTGGRRILRAYSTAIDAIDRILDSVDDDELAVCRGVLVRRYLDLLSTGHRVFDQEEQPEGR